MVTRRSMAVLSLAVGTLLLGMGSGFALYYYISVLTVLILLVGGAWCVVSLWRLHVGAERIYGHLGVGESMESRLELVNNAPLPRFGLEVRDLEELPGHSSGQVVNLAASGQATMSLHVPLRKRGVYTIQQPAVYAVDPFGVFRMSRRQPGEDQLVVFPHMARIPPFVSSHGEVSGEGELARQAPSASSSVSTVREYQPGESYRYVHWPSTARKSSLMLKQFDTGVEDVTWVLLDLHQDVQAGDDLDNTEEYAVSVAASVARAYSGVGWAVGLAADGDRRYNHSPLQGAPALERLLRTLTEARATGVVPFHDLLTSWRAQHATGVASLVAVTSSLDHRWVEALEATSRSGIPSTAVLVDPVSFGASGDAALIMSRLRGFGAAVRVVRRGDDLAHALQNQSWLRETDPTREPAAVQA